MPVIVARASVLLFFLFPIPILIAPVQANDTVSTSVVAFSPWSYVRDGKQYGRFVDAQRKIAIEAGFTPDLKVSPFLRVTHDIKLGKSAFTLLSTNPEIEAAADPAALLGMVDVVVASSADDPVKSLDDLKGRTVATILGASSKAFIQKKLQDVTFIPIHTSEQLLKLLGVRATAIAIGKPTLIYELKMLPEDKRPKLAPFFTVGRMPVYLWISKKADPAVAERIKAAFKKIKARGDFDHILED